MTVTKEVMDEVETLRRSISETTLTLGDLSEAIKDREIARIKETFNPSGEEKEAISKWFWHYEDSEKIKSEIETLDIHNNSDEIEYVLISSEMFSTKKHQRSDDGTYHARWIVRKDDTEGYFIHRLEWQQSFENPLSEINNPLETTRNWLGFDEYLPEDTSTINNDVWYQIQGDIALRFKPYDSNVESRARQQANNELDTQKETAFKNWKTSDSQNITTIDTLSVTRSISRINVNAKATSTDVLKDLQRELGYDEQTIRDEMKDNWTRLTANRRKGIIEKLVKREVTEYLDEHTPDKDKLKDAYSKEIRNADLENTTQQNILIGNHLLTIDHAIRTQSQRGITATVIIPSTGTITLLHDEHSNKELQVKESVIELKVLTRHEQA